MHGTEAGLAEEDMDGLQMRLSSIKNIYIYISGIRPPEMKSDYTQSTVRETLGITHGSCSEGASNLTGEVCRIEKINNKVCAKLMVSQKHMIHTVP